MAGDSADVALSGIDVALLRAGCVLCHPSFPVQLAARFTARVLVLQVCAKGAVGQSVLCRLLSLWAPPPGGGGGGPPPPFAFFRVVAIYTFPVLLTHFRTPQT